MCSLVKHSQSQEVKNAFSQHMKFYVQLTCVVNLIDLQIKILASFTHHFYLETVFHLVYSHKLNWTEFNETYQAFIIILMTIKLTNIIMIQDIKPILAILPVLSFFYTKNFDKHESQPNYNERKLSANQTHWCHPQWTPMTKLNSRLWPGSAWL